MIFQAGGKPRNSSVPNTAQLQLSTELSTGLSTGVLCSPSDFGSITNDYKQVLLVTALLFKLKLEQDPNNDMGY